MLIELPDRRQRSAFLAHADAELDTLSVASLLTLVAHPRTRPLAARVFARHRAPLVAMIRGEIARRCAAGDRGAEEPLGADLLGHLLSARDGDGQVLHATTICDEVLSALVAMRDVLALALTWALERLAHSPGVWERLGTPDGDETYPQAVVDEALRVRPPVLGAFRGLAGMTELGGQAHPAGRLVMTAIPVLHQRANAYSTPHLFLPERFTTMSATSTRAWIPFGAGLRRCLGEDLARATMRIVLSTITTHTQLRPAYEDEESAHLLGAALIPARQGRVIRDRW